MSICFRFALRFPDGITRVRRREARQPRPRLRLRKSNGRRGISKKGSANADSGSRGGISLEDAFDFRKRCSHQVDIQKLAWEAVTTLVRSKTRIEAARARSEVAFAAPIVITRGGTVIVTTRCDLPARSKMSLCGGCEKHYGLP